MRRSQYYDKKERGRQFSKELPPNKPIRAMPMSTSKYKEHALQIEARSDINNSITTPFSMYELDSRGTTPKASELEKKIARTIQELETEITRAKIKIQEQRPGSSGQRTNAGRERGRSLGPMKADTFETNLLQTSPIKQSQSISQTSQDNKLQTAKQSLYSLLRNNGVELTKYLREGITNIFENLSLQNNLTRENKEKTESIGDSLKIYATMYNNMKLDAEYNAKTMKFDREEIERDLEKLKQEAFRQIPYKEYETSVYSTKKRSSSQAMKRENEELSQMILETKKKINNFFEKLRKNDMITTQYDEIIRKKDQLIQSIMSERGRELNNGEFDQDKKKDEQIKKMQLELDAVDYLLKRKKEEQGKLKEDNSAICEQVQKFLSSMQRLQRAVAKQDTMNLSGLKEDFEANKKDLIALTKASSPFGTPVKTKEPSDTISSSAPIAKYKVKQVGSQSQLQELERKIKEYENNNARLTRDMKDLAKYKTDAEDLELKLNDQDIIIKDLKTKEEQLILEKNHINALVEQKERENVLLNEMMERMTQDNKIKEGAKKTKRNNTLKIKEKITQIMQEIIDNTEDEMNRQLSKITEQEEKVEEIYKALDYYKEQRKELDENNVLLQEMQAEKVLLQEELQKARSDYEKMEKEKDGIIKELKDATNYEDIKQQQDELRNMILEKSNEIEASFGQFQKLQSDYEVIQQELILKNDQIEKLSQGLNETQEKNKKQMQELKNVILETKKEKDELSKQIEIQLENFKKLEEENTEISKKNEQLNDQNEENLAQIKDRENQNEQLKLQISQLEKYKRQAASVPKLKLTNIGLHNLVIQQEKRLGTELKRISEIVQKTFEGGKNAEKLLEEIKKTKELQNAFAELLKTKLANHQASLAKYSEEAFDLVSQLQAKEEEKNALIAQNAELTNKLNDSKNQYEQLRKIYEEQEFYITNINNKIAIFSAQPIKENIIEIKEMLIDQAENFNRFIKTGQSKLLLSIKKWEEKRIQEKGVFEQKIKLNEQQNTGTLQDILKEKQILQERLGEYEEEVNSLKAQLAAVNEAKTRDNKLILECLQSNFNKINETTKKYLLASKTYEKHIIQFDNQIKIIHEEIKEKIVKLHIESEEIKLELKNAKDAYNDLEVNLSDQLAASMKAEKEKSILNEQIENLTNQLNDANNKQNELHNLSHNQIIAIEKLKKKIVSINIQPIKTIQQEIKNELNEQNYMNSNIIENARDEFNSQLKIYEEQLKERAIVIEKQNAQVLQELLKEKQNLQEKMGDMEEKAAAQQAELDQNEAKVMEAKGSEYNLIKEYYNSYLNKINATINEYETVNGQHTILLDNQIKSISKIKEKLLITQQESVATKAKLKSSQDAYNDLKLKMNFTSEQLAVSMKAEEEKSLLVDQVEKLKNELNASKIEFNQLRIKFEEQQALLLKMYKKITVLSIQPIKSTLSDIINETNENHRMRLENIENLRRELIEKINCKEAERKEENELLKEKIEEKEREYQGLLEENQNFKQKIEEYENKASEQKYIFEEKLAEYEINLKSKRKEENIIKNNILTLVKNFKATEDIYQEASIAFSKKINDLVEQNKNLQKAKEMFIMSHQESEQNKIKTNEHVIQQQQFSQEIALKMKLAEEKLANLLGISGNENVNLIELIEHVSNEIQKYRNQKENLYLVSPNYEQFNDLELKIDIKTKELQNKFQILCERIKTHELQNADDKKKLKQELLEKGKTIDMLELRAKMLNDELIKMNNFIKNTKELTNIQKIKQYLSEFEQNMEIAKIKLNEKIRDSQRLFMSQANEIASLRQSVSSSKMEDKETITKIVKEKTNLEMENSKMKEKIDTLEKEINECKGKLKIQTAKINREKDEIIRKFTAFSQWIVELQDKNNEYCRITEERIMVWTGKIWEKITQLYNENANASVRLKEMLGMGSVKGKLPDMVDRIQMYIVKLDNEKLEVRNLLEEYQAKFNSSIERIESQSDSSMIISSLLEKTNTLNQYIQKYKINWAEQSQQIKIYQQNLAELKQKVQEQGQIFKQFVLDLKNNQHNALFEEYTKKIMCAIKGIVLNVGKNNNRLHMQKLEEVWVKMNAIIDAKANDLSLYSDRINARVENASSSIYQRFNGTLNELLIVKREIAEKEKLLLILKEKLDKLTQEHSNKSENLEIIQNKTRQIVELFEKCNENITTELMLTDIESKIKEDKAQIDKLTVDFAAEKEKRISDIKSLEKESESARKLNEDITQKLQNSIALEENQKLTIQSMQEEIIGKNEKLKFLELRIQENDRKTKEIMAKYSQDLSESCKGQLADLENRIAQSNISINKILTLSKLLTPKEKLQSLQANIENANIETQQLLKEKEKKIEDLQMDQAFNAAELRKQESQIAEIKTELETKAKEHSLIIEQINGILQREGIQNVESVIAGIEQLISYYKNAVSQEEDEKESCFTELEQAKALLDTKTEEMTTLQQETVALKTKEDEYNETKTRLINILGVQNLQENNLIEIVQKVENLIIQMRSKREDGEIKEQNPSLEFLELQSNYSIIEQQNLQAKSAIENLKKAIVSFIEKISGSPKDLNLEDLPNELEKISTKLKDINEENGHKIKQMNVDKEISDQKHLEELSKKEEEITRIKKEHEENTKKEEIKWNEQLKGKDQMVLINNIY